MCECVKKLAELNVLQPNIMVQNQYFIYPTKLDKNQNLKVVKTPYLINFCPNCGQRVAHSEGKKGK